jgi:hypothetical protein
MICSWLLLNHMFLDKLCFVHPTFMLRPLFQTPVSNYLTPSTWISSKYLNVNI